MNLEVSFLGKGNRTGVIARKQPFYKQHGL
jgi:hypothetical protein